MINKANEKKDYRHIICASITLISLLCTIFIFSNSIGRIIESVRDLAVSFAYYFCEIIGIKHNITPTVNSIPKTPFIKFFDGFDIPLPTFPDSWKEFKADWKTYWKILFTKTNLQAYVKFLAILLYNLSQAIMLILPFVLLIYVIFTNSFNDENNDYNLDSKNLKRFKQLEKRYYLPTKTWVISFYEFLKSNIRYVKVWCYIWALNFNLITILIEFVAFYLYLCVSFDLANIYTQFYKLLCDLWTPIVVIPVIAWIVLFIIMFDRFCKKLGYNRLQHFEMKNRGFINSLPIVFMDCGTMGSRKTTMITDMALSSEVMLRDKAFEKILENDLKFPFFPWINLENEVKRVMAFHHVYNLATVRQFIAKKKRRWEKKPTVNKLFDYDYERYGLTYDDKLKVVDIWEVLEIYAQLYFIYVIQSSLLISNYSIRVDSVLNDLGNFPLWNTDFFQTDSRLIDSYSRHAHILDFDTIRLGRKVIENNEKANCFDFGVVVITEVGKERGNSLELSGKSKKDDIANQKNDLLNHWLKMVRHSATVDNYPFVKVITDEQRPESWGADARQLCEIIHIRESGEKSLAMPFFELYELIYACLFGLFRKLYYDYRYSRSDNTLLMYLFKKIMVLMYRHYTFTYNRFGYYKIIADIEQGVQDGNFKQKEYYLMWKKIYSKRFSTDCFSDFFAEKNLRSPVGINDLPEYATEKASFEELKQQNSYFVNDLLQGINEEKE